MPGSAITRKLENEVQVEKFDGKEFLSLTRESVPIRHDDVPIRGLAVQNNGFSLEEEKLSHIFEIDPRPDLVGDMTIVKSVDPHSVKWARRLGYDHGARFMMFPEVHHMIKATGRAEICQISSHLSVEDRRLKRKFRTRACFGSLGSVGKQKKHKEITLAPFLAVDIKPAGENDHVFFFPIDQTNLDPNWFICFVKNVRPVSEDISSAVA